MYDKNSAKQKHYFNKKKKNKIGSKLRTKPRPNKKRCTQKLVTKKFGCSQKKYYKT